MGGIPPQPPYSRGGLSPPSIPPFSPPPEVLWKSGTVLGYDHPNVAALQLAYQTTSQNPT